MNAEHKDDAEPDLLSESSAAMRSVVPLFLNKRRCDDDDDCLILTNGHTCNS